MVLGTSSTIAATLPLPLKVLLQDGLIDQVMEKEIIVLGLLLTHLALDTVATLMIAKTEKHQENAETYGMLTEIVTHGESGSEIQMVAAILQETLMELDKELDQELQEAMLIGLQPILTAQDILHLIAILMNNLPLKNTTIKLAVEEHITSVEILLTEFGLYGMIAATPLLLLKVSLLDGQTDPLMEKEQIATGLL